MKYKLFFIAIVLVLAAACLSACGFVEVHDVNLHFVIDGVPFCDMTVSSFSANGIDVGEKEGYYFDGWYSDSDYRSSVEPSRLTVESTLYGRWRQEETNTVSYTVTFVVEGVVYDETEATSVSDIKYPVAPQKEGYVFSEWSGRPLVLEQDITLVAVFRPIYTVSFFDESGNLLSSGQVAEGGFVTPPVPPKKEGDREYRYEFDCWWSAVGDYNNVQNDLEVYATYREITNEYRCVLHYENGQKDRDDLLEYDTRITLPSPTKAATVDTTYTFVGWDTDGDGVSDDVFSPFRLHADFEAWAIYAASPRAYTVVFDVDGETETFSVEYGSSVSYSGALSLTRAPTAQFTYTFEGWDTDGDEVVDDGLSSVVSDVRAVAVFSSVVNTYTYRFFLSEGALYCDEVTAPYGTAILLPEVDPEMAASDSYEFEFSYWSGYEADMLLTQDVDFYARFDMHVRLYSVKFTYKNRTLKTYQLPYGTVIDYDEAVKPCPYPVEDDKNYAYSWSNWEPDYVVRRNVTFDLNRDSNYQYVVTWKMDESTDYCVAYYRDGDILALPAPPEREGYTFVEWQDYQAADRVHADRTLLAVWHKDAVVVTKYLVSFFDEAGKLISFEQVEEGGAATPPVPPQKEGNQEYSYVFNGWWTANGDYNNVQSDVNVYARYLAIVNTYRCVLHYNNGEEDFADSLQYDVLVTLPSPAKAATVDTAYTFVGWDTDGDGVSDDVSSPFRLHADFEAWAIYEASPRAYSVVFRDNDDVLAEYSLPYGTVIDYDEAVKPCPYPVADDAHYAYSWSDWEPDYAVERDVVFLLNRYSDYQYVVTWKIDEATDYCVAYYRDGDVLALPAPPEREGYTFIEWQDYQAADRVHADRTLLAVWQSAQS